VKSSDAAVIALLLALSVASPGHAQPAFKNRKGPEKEFVAQVGEATVRAARTKPVKLAMEEYKITTPARDRKLLAIRMVWYGSVTGKKFTSDVKITVDSTKQDRWEVLDIHYVDDFVSTRGPSARSLERLKEQFNR
jgi:hypothetical protein